MSRITCVGCEQFTLISPCERCQWTCTRKKEYPTYEQAKDVMVEMRKQGEMDPRLHPYHCPIRGDHYHLGRAKGQLGQTLIKRHKKLQRQAVEQHIKLIQNKIRNQDGRVIRKLSTRFTHWAITTPDWYVEVVNDRETKTVVLFEDWLASRPEYQTAVGE